jgi:hypothetical protein
VEQFVSKKKTKYVVVSENGPRCRRCGRHMQVREHDQIREKQLRQPFYYSRWYNCSYRSCKTTLVMPEEYIVWNDEHDGELARRLQAIREQLKPRS